MRTSTLTVTCALLASTAVSSAPAHAFTARAAYATFAGTFATTVSRADPYGTYRKYYPSATCAEVSNATGTVSPCTFWFTIINRVKPPPCTQIESGVVLNGWADYRSGALATEIDGTPISGGGVNGNGHMHGAIIEASGTDVKLLNIDLNIAETCEELDGEAVRAIHFVGVITYT